MREQTLRDIVGAKGGRDETYTGSDEACTETDQSEFKMKWCRRHTYIITTMRTKPFPRWIGVGRSHLRWYCRSERTGSMTGLAEPAVSRR